MASRKWYWQNQGGFCSGYIWTEFPLSSLVRGLWSNVLGFLLRCFSPDRSWWRTLVFMEWHVSLLAPGLQSCHPVHVLWRFKTAAFKETTEGNPWFWKQQSILCTVLLLGLMWFVLSLLPSFLLWMCLSSVQYPKRSPPRSPIPCRQSSLFWGWVLGFCLHLVKQHCKIVVSLFEAMLIKQYSQLVGESIPYPFFHLFDTLTARLAIRSLSSSLLWNEVYIGNFLGNTVSQKTPVWRKFL